MMTKKNELGPAPASASHTTRRGGARSLALLVALAGGCYGVDEETEHLGRVVEALNGSVTFVPVGADFCDDAEQALIHDAMSIAQLQVLGAQRQAMQRCLEDAVLSPDEDALTEEILARLSQNVPTVISCESFTGANAKAVGTTSERFRFAHGFLRNDFDGEGHPPPSAARVASVMLHELTHNKGYTHFWGEEGADGRASREYEYSVPEQIEKCSLSVSAGTTRPNGQPRSAMQGEVELQPVGGGHGAAFEALCPADRSGVYGLGFTASSGGVSQISFVCRASPNGPAGSAGGHLGSPGTPVNRACPVGKVAVGIAGAMSVDDIGSLTLLCAEEARVRNNQTYTAQPATPFASVNGMHAFLRQCPQGMWMRGVYGRTDNLSTDQLRVVCQRPGLSVLPNAFALAPMGTGPVDLFVRRDFCSDQGAMTGLHGFFNASRINRVGGVCQGLTRAATTQRWTIRNTESHITPGRGIYTSAGAAFNEQWTDSPSDDQRDVCPQGQVLVGVAAGLGPVGEVASLAGQCANMDTWNTFPSTTTPHPVTFTSVFGRTVSASSLGVVRTCPRMHYLVGLEVARGTAFQNYTPITGVMRVTPFCRYFANP